MHFHKAFAEKTNRKHQVQFLLWLLIVCIYTYKSNTGSGPTFILCMVQNALPCGIHQHIICFQLEGSLRLPNRWRYCCSPMRFISSLGEKINTWIKEMAFQSAVIYRWSLHSVQWFLRTHLNARGPSWQHSSFLNYVTKIIIVFHYSESLHFYF